MDIEAFKSGLYDHNDTIADDNSLSVSYKGNLVNSTLCELPKEHTIYRKKEKAKWKKTIHSVDELPYESDNPDWERFILGPVGVLDEKNDCGEIIGYKRCHKITELRKSCDNLSCPTCYTKPLHRSVSQVVGRQKALIKQYYDDGDYRGPVTYALDDHLKANPIPIPSHFVLTTHKDNLPTEEDFKADITGAYTKIKRLGQNMIKKAFRGFYAGVLVLHTHRLKHTDGSTCEEKHCGEEHVMVYSPHFHLIGYGYTVSYDDYFNATGWQIRRLPDTGHRDFEATLAYLLTHSAVLYRQYNHEIVCDGEHTGQFELRTRARQTYMLVGAFSHNLARIEKTVEMVDDLCHECGQLKLTHAALHMCGSVTVNPEGEHRPIPQISYHAVTYRLDPRLELKWKRWWRLRNYSWGPLRTTERLRPDGSQAM